MSKQYVEQREGVHWVAGTRVSLDSRDPKDDVVIACALRARAPYIVTRDDDLHSLRTYRRIQMITP